MTVRRRLDTELVRRGLVPSRTAAQAAIAEHLVTVGGSIAGKPSHLVAPGDPVELLGRRPASWAGAARSSTPRSSGSGSTSTTCGPWTRAPRPGASPTASSSGVRPQVVAVDVGHGQLHPAVRDDPRVDVRERCNVRGT